MNTLPPSLIALPAASQATGPDSQPLPLPIPGLPQPPSTTPLTTHTNSSPSLPAPQDFSEVFAGVMLVPTAPLEPDLAPEDTDPDDTLTSFAPETGSESPEDPQESTGPSLHPLPIQIPVYHIPAEEIIEPTPPSDSLLSTTPAIPEEELVDPSEPPAERRIVPVNFNRTSDPEDPDPFGQSNRTPSTTPLSSHPSLPNNTGTPADPRTHSSPHPPRTQRNPPHTPTPPVATELSAPDAATSEPSPILPRGEAAPAQPGAAIASATQPESAHPDPPAPIAILDPTQTPAPTSDTTSSAPLRSNLPLTRAPLSSSAPEAARIPVPNRPTDPSSAPLASQTQPESTAPHPNPTPTPPAHTPHTQQATTAFDPAPQANPEAVPSQAHAPQQTQPARSNTAPAPTPGSPSRPAATPAGSVRTDVGTTPEISEPTPANPTYLGLSPSQPMPGPAPAQVSTTPPSVGVAPIPPTAPAQSSISGTSPIPSDPTPPTPELNSPRVPASPDPDVTGTDGRIRVPRRTQAAQTASAAPTPRSSLGSADIEVHSLSTQQGSPTPAAPTPETATRTPVPRRSDPATTPQRPGSRASLAMSMTSTAPGLGLVGDSRHVLVPDETIQRSTHLQPSGTSVRPPAAQSAATQALPVSTPAKPLEPARISPDPRDASAPLSGSIRAAASPSTAPVVPQATAPTLREGSQPQPSAEPAPATAAPLRVTQGQPPSAPVAAPLQSALPTPPAPLETQPALRQIQTRATPTSAPSPSDPALPERLRSERTPQPTLTRPSAPAARQATPNTGELTSPVYLSAAQIGWTNPSPLPLPTTGTPGNTPTAAQSLNESQPAALASDRTPSSAGTPDRPLATGAAALPLSVPLALSSSLLPTLPPAQTALANPTPVETATGLVEAGLLPTDQDKRNPNISSINTLERQKEPISTTEPRDGTPVAPQGSEMKNGAFMDNSAGGGRQEESRFLAYRSPHPRTNRGVGAASEPGDGSTPAISTPTSAALGPKSPIDVPPPIPTPRGATVLDRIVQMLDREIQVMRQLSPESMAVTVRPDAHTSIFLELHQQDGQITAKARLEQGDIQSLRDAWPELQRLMAARGIELAPVEDRSRPALSNVNPELHGGATADQGQANGRRSRDQEPRNLDQLPLVGSLTEPPKKGARLRKSDGKHLLESWA